MKSHPKKVHGILRLTAYLTLLTSCSSSATLQAIKAARTQVESTVTTTTSGTVDAERQAVLGFTIAGRVAKVHVRAGDPVKQGQVLAELENTELRTILRDSESELKRSNALKRAGLISQVAQDEAQRNVDVAQANLDRTIIRAPFDGLITEKNMQIGELAQPSGSLAPTSTESTSGAPLRLVDQKPRLIKGTIDEIDLAKVRPGSEARVRIPAIGAKDFQAKVTRVVPYVNPTKEQDRTAQIELKLTGGPPPSALPVGASADIEIIVGRKSDALAVPSRTVLGVGSARYVFRFDGGKARRTQVKVGLAGTERTEITEGLEPGQTVVFPPEDFELSDGKRIKAEVRPWP